MIVLIFRFFSFTTLKTGNLFVEIVYFWDPKFVAEVRIIYFELYMPEGVINLSSNDLLG